MLVYCGNFTILSPKKQYNVSEGIGATGQREIVWPAIRVFVGAKAQQFDTINKGV